jgi:hypothetical protein
MWRCPVIEGPADPPLENAASVCWVGDAALRSITKQGDDVVAADCPPMDDAGGRRPPTLDAGEQSLDARAVVGDLVIDAEDTSAENLSRALGVKDRRQVLRPGKDVDVGFALIVILRQALVGRASDDRRIKVPSKAQDAVAGAGIVGQLQLGRHSRSAEWQWDGESGRTCG